MGDDHRIYYFSATGNTALACRWLGEEAERAGCPVPRIASIEDEPSPTRADLPGRLLGLATPVMAFQPPLPMVRFIEALPPAPLGDEAPFVYFVVTGASWVGNCFHKLARLVRGRGYRVLGGQFVTGEESWTCVRFPWLVWARGCPRKDERRGLSIFAAQLTAALAGRRRAVGRSLAWHPTALHLDLLAFLHRPARWSFIWPKFLDRRRCTRCGRCAASCPAGVIDRHPGGWPQPRRLGCVGCFRCINLCPTDALNTRRTRGRLRFRGPDTTDGLVPNQWDLMGRYGLLVAALVGIVFLAAWVLRN